MGGIRHDGEKSGNHERGLWVQSNGDVRIHRSFAKPGSSAMKGKPPNYLSYLLRLWSAGNSAESTWRASLENPMTGERQGFASVRELFTFLQAQVEGLAGPASRDDDAEQTGGK